MKHKRIMALTMAVTMLTAGCGEGESGKTTYQFDGTSVTLSGSSKTKLPKDLAILNSA